MCNICGRPFSYPCNCINTRPSCPSTYDCDCPTGKIDFSCIIYHKDNNQTSELPNLGLQNGATLQLIVETIDTKLSVLDFVSPTPALPYLRLTHVITTLAAFASSVDAELERINTLAVSGDSWTTVARPTGAALTPGKDGYNITLHQREYWNEFTSAWVQY